MSTKTFPGLGIEALAVVMGTLLSGNLMSLSLITMPVLVETSQSTPLLLKQWRRIFDRGHVQGPFLAVSTLLTYSCAAWMAASSGGSWLPFAAAGTLTMGIVPYTWIFMWNINCALFDAEAASAKREDAVEKKIAVRMIRSWTALHAVRSLFPLAGAVTGLIALLNKKSL